MLGVVTRVVHVPHVVEQEEAISDLRGALEALLDVVGLPGEFRVLWRRPGEARTRGSQNRLL